MEYRTSKHCRMPHVVKVSGGRSSAMLLMRLLDRRVLFAERGDVVVFNNTSAEAHSTYLFLQELTTRTEEQGIPFYWTEYCTYEKEVGEKYHRTDGFKLVHPVWKDERNPHGFHHKGEVFEEFVSHRGYLPNKYKRTCTSHLKILVYLGFLNSWFSDSDRIEQMGKEGFSRMTNDALMTRYRKFGGSLTPDELFTIRAYSRQRPAWRPEQLFNDYSKTGKKHKIVEIGDNYLGITGFRADEKNRVDRLRGLENSTPEIVYAPLADAGITNKDVQDYWRFDSDFDLGLPAYTTKSNCVYCFMKGPYLLKDVLKTDPGGSDTPEAIGWWVNLENKYKRKYEVEIFGRKEYAANGCFGKHHMEDPNRLDYENLRKFNSSVLDEKEDLMPCECFD